MVVVGEPAAKGRGLGIVRGSLDYQMAKLIWFGG
tara:strand:+ start:242 stop:343 length:102 start_codon:yes stop_codon:yes gene_type:complete